MCYSDEAKKIIMRYVGRFGDKKPSDLGFKEAYTCPKCGGSGILHQYTSDGRGEYDYKCEICGGIGYTERQLKPKMEQVGWE